MFCCKCGKEITSANIRFCPQCGYELHFVSNGQKPIIQQKVILAPEDMIEAKEKVTSDIKTYTGTGKALSILLEIGGILCDIIAMVTILTGAYELFSILIVGGTIAFVVGLALSFFCS